MNHIELPIIGYVRSPLVQKFGIPRQPNLVNVRAQLEFVPPFGNPQAFVGIEQFSHLWVIWQFHQALHDTPFGVAGQNFRPQVRPPRLGGNAKIGVFASRSMFRPSGLGLSVVQLAGMQVVEGQTQLDIIGADMVDGTPVVDVKPYLAYSDRVAATSGYADTPPGHKLVTWQAQAQMQLDQLIQIGALAHDDGAIIHALIAQDPRPAYRQHDDGRVYSVRYGKIDVDFVPDGQGLAVVALRECDWSN